MIRRALISVWDKTGIVDFARALHEEFGIEIISTGGTAKTLREAGIPVTLIEVITGFPEMLDGRVKTLHPAIHAGILADRDNAEHMRQLAAAGIKPIDMVVVNLYPFEKTIADPNCTFEQAIEMIDIGGVALLRAAAKNHRHVLVACAADSYHVVLEALRDPNGLLAKLRLGEPEQLFLAGRDIGAFAAYYATSDYDWDIAAWLSRALDPQAQPFVRGAAGVVVDRLRYGENPPQSADAVQIEGVFDLAVADAETTDSSGQPKLSYNNYLDADAALGLCAELTRAAATGKNLWHRSLWHRFPTGDCFHGFPTRAAAEGRPVANRISQEQWTERNLPHLQVPGATYFVTFRLRQGQLNPAERDVVLAACTYWHGKKLTLHCASVMPDHVHLLLTPHEVAPGRWVSLGELLHSIKRYSAKEINLQRGVTGAMWMDEAFDRVMRNEKEFGETWEYIEANPVTARIIERLPYQWFWRSDYGFQEWAGNPRRHGLETRENSHRLETGATGTGATGTGATGTGATGAGPGVAACVFVKHNNPCGTAVGSSAIEAYRKAYLADPNAAMGGVLACNFEIDAEFAAAVMETYDRLGKPLKEAGAANAPGGFFVEVWIAPSFTEAAIAVIRGNAELLAAAQDRGGAAIDEDRIRALRELPAVQAPKKWGQNVRLLAVGDMSQPLDPNELQYRSIAGGMLVQTPDLLGLNEEEWKVVTERAPTEAELADLRLAWLICKHTKSNAISIVRDGMLIGNGAGQMSRVMSCRVAVWLARENGHLGEGNREQGTGNSEQGTANRPVGVAPVAASDAFFPFPDGPTLLIDAGVTAIIQPGGSKRDEQTIALCNQRGVAMIFTGTRHFRH